ncbi:hypothetical protein QQS21_010727 [Conoideocrella luteorostrata]|uniref:Phenylacetaldoxime dehydratase n=1 Tax=Conoideocrella luteorostrata TaxID=1105319 RepID=A0AAJ0CIX0_9HYPO|nr:hypothetical protein QQS21_010727 [Conoideocrella luteorostrata]
MACAARTHPLRQPPNHKPPVPRWQLVLPGNVTRIFTAYIGIQPRSGTTAKAVLDQVSSRVEAWLHEESPSRPQTAESFVVLDGDDVRGAKVWLCYWDDEIQGKEALRRLDLPSVHSALPSTDQSSTGIWSESFSTPTTRLETNYTGLDYLPGLAQLHNTSTEPHTMTAYWGAARDRISDSAHDLFEKDAAIDMTPRAESENSTTRHLSGVNYKNMIHIRSGQFWQSCEPEETSSYEESLEPTLRAGLQYLWDNRLVSGALGLRYLRNTDGTDRILKETCGAGFFCNLQNLEDWAKKHPSHVAIYTGAIKHARRFGEGRKFRTWHEVSVLNEGDAHFEYINCLPKTGVIRFLKLQEVEEKRVGSEASQRE